MTERIFREFEKLDISEKSRLQVSEQTQTIQEKATLVNDKLQIDQIEKIVQNDEGVKLVVTFKNKTGMNQSVTLSQASLTNRIKVLLKQSDKGQTSETIDAQKNSNPQDSSAPRD